jgi:hypothetical protein
MKAYNTKLKNPGTTTAEGNYRENQKLLKNSTAWSTNCSLNGKTPNYTEKIQPNWDFNHDTPMKKSKKISFCHKFLRFRENLEKGEFWRKSKIEGACEEIRSTNDQEVFP